MSDHRTDPARDDAADAANAAGAAAALEAIDVEIAKLRADLEKKEGAQFSLRQFHDDFLKQGFPPIKIVRRALLGRCPAGSGPELGFSRSPGPDAERLWQWQEQRSRSRWSRWRSRKTWRQTRTWRPATVCSGSSATSSDPRR